MCEGLWVFQGAMPRQPPEGGEGMVKILAWFTDANFFEKKNLNPKKQAFFPENPDFTCFST